MRILSWNIRGLNSNVKVSALRKIIRVQKSSGLLIIWDKIAFEEENVEVFRNFILLEGKWIREDLRCTILNVYAPCSLDEQKRLWEEIINIKVGHQGKWLVGGDLTWFSCSVNNGKDFHLSWLEFDNLSSKCKLIQFRYVERVENEMAARLAFDGFSSWDCFNAWW
ncbi:hypothetical protein V6N13_019627 [Hibiscus sabdariffa]